MSELIAVFFSSKPIHMSSTINKTYLWEWINIY